MTNERIKALIVLYGDSVRYKKKLLDCKFTEEILSVIPTCTKNQNTLEEQLGQKIIECRKLKERLETAKDNVLKLYTKYKENAQMKEFLDFAISLSTFRDFDEETRTTSNSEDNDFLCQYISVEDYSDVELINDVKHEHLCPTQEFCDGDPPKDDSKSIIERSQLVDAKKIIATNPDPRNISLESSMTSEKSTLSQDSDKSVQKLTSSPFKSDTRRKHFSKKKRSIFHVREDTKKSLLFQCEKCGKSFPMKNSKERIEKCPTCDVHDNDHRDEDKKKLPIVALKRERNRKSEKIDDSVGRSPSEISSLCCDICGRQYSGKSSLETHMRHVHFGEKPYECIECGKRFAWKHDMKRHTLVHGSQKPFKCSVCDVTFKHSNAKLRHERIVHERDAHLQCAHCDKRFGRKDKLISHIQAKHFSGFKKRFTCTICGKSFATNQGFKVHQFMHTS